MARGVDIDDREFHLDDFRFGEDRMEDLTGEETMRVLDALHASDAHGREAAFALIRHELKMIRTGRKMTA